MATADVLPAAEPAAGLPDYVTDPDAVLKDQAHWRYGRAPDYTKTRKVYAESTYTRLLYFPARRLMPREARC